MSQSIELTDAISGNLDVQPAGRLRWRVVQPSLPPPYENAQPVTWLRIENPGRPRMVAIEIEWADATWMNYRGFGYQKVGRTYRPVAGRIGSARTAFDLRVPGGVSYFGAAPWYDNDDGKRFLRRTARKSPACEVRTLGHSGDGRPILCLTISAARCTTGKPNVLVLAREHANETAGSFAIEAVAAFLLGEGGRLLGDHVFHLVPIINPDGVADGTKLTREGPVKEVDVYQGGMTSDDPTCRTLRETVLSLRPACVVSYHSYLQLPPACMFFDKQDGMTMLDDLLDVDTWVLARGPKTWRDRGHVLSVWHVNRMPPDHTLWGHCLRAFRSVVSVPELSWHGRSVREVEELGLASFMAAMRALNARGQATSAC